MHLRLCRGRRTRSCWSDRRSRPATTGDAGRRPARDKGGTMKFGMQVGYSGAGIDDSVETAKLADELGFHSIWTAEAYGSDAITPLVWMGAHTKNVKLATGIMQMPARSPAMTAMTAATLDALVRRTVHLRHRAVRPPGRGGLARRPLREAAREDPRVRRDPARDLGTREAARVLRRALSDPLRGTGRDRARQATEVDPAPTRGHPDRDRSDRSEEHRAVR